MPGGKEIIIEDSVMSLARRGADIFCRTAKESIERQGRFAVAISGGSTPRAMFRFLSQEPYSSAIPWQSLHLFWVDERMVAFDDPRSNFGAAKEDFLDKVPLPPDHLHPMPTWAEPSDGASVYQAELKGFFQRFGEVDMPIFDLVFLGLGKDGHTASLFPGKDPALNPAEWVLSVKGGDPDVFRLTLNYHVLNRAKRVVFLVSGKEKASILKTIFEDKEARLPAQEIRPVNGKLTWLLDQEAASLL